MKCLACIVHKIVALTVGEKRPVCPSLQLVITTLLFICIKSCIQEPNASLVMAKYPKYSRRSQNVSHILFTPFDQTLTSTSNLCLKCHLVLCMVKEPWTFMTGNNLLGMLPRWSPSRHTWRPLPLLNFFSPAPFHCQLPLLRLLLLYIASSSLTYICFIVLQCDIVNS